MRNIFIHIVVNENKSPYFKGKMDNFNEVEFRLLRK